MANAATTASTNGANKTSAPTSQHDSNATSQPKRGKGKKNTDPVNTTKEIEDRIAQLEKNKAGEKDQEAEIEREVKRANRDLSHHLSAISDPLLRVDTIQKKYTELLSDMKRMERECNKAKKRSDQLQKEKDATRSELSKEKTFKDKLEKLCRELQRDNKKLKEDQRRLGDTETRMRKELHDRLETMAGEVQEVIAQRENPESLPANVEADESFRQKFKSFCDQYELRELQFYSLLRTKELELQNQVARYESQKKASEQEAQKSRQLTTQVSTFSQTETELRGQLNIYVEKFKQVEDTLNNSNDLFLTFRREMEEMSKKTKRLEKENQNLTRKHELTNSNILQMAEDRTKANKEIGLLRKKNDNLEKLCRGMQAQGRTNATSDSDLGAPRGKAGDVDMVGEEPCEAAESDYEDDEEEEEDYDDEEDEGSEDDEYADLDVSNEVSMQEHILHQQRNLQHGQASSGAQQRANAGLHGQRPLPDFAGTQAPGSRAMPLGSEGTNHQTPSTQMNGVKH